MVIITVATLDAFNDYYNFFNLKDKALLYISTKAIKKMSFHHGPMSTCCSSPQWGVEIAITYTDKPVQVKKEMYNFGQPPDQAKKSPKEKSIPISKRQIVVCRNV
jgi:hypothetical protein